MSELVYVKYCPLCGAENARQQAFCRQCLDGDLTTVPAEPRRELLAAGSCSENNGPTCVLELIDDPAVRFCIHEGQTVGRTEKADIILRNVPKLDWISGVHAQFSRRGEQWYVKHLGDTNFIKVDGEQFSGQEDVALYDGSILVLSLTPFRVSFTGGAQ